LLAEIVQTLGNAVSMFISKPRSAGEVPAAGSSSSSIFGEQASAIATSSCRFWP